MIHPVHGRGAPSNPPNRFEAIQYDAEIAEADYPEDPRPSLKTRFYRDLSASLICYNDSPDIGFNASANPYRGCEHGCAYCYARPTHEYLGWSAGLDFESKILVKEDAPTILRRELLAGSWRPQVIAMSGVTDCYQPAERHFQITRRCLAVLAEFRNPVAIITKNHLVTRDLDVLGELAAHRAAVVNLSITTLDPKLARLMEPRASTPTGRLDAIRRLREAGIPVGVMVAPIIPGLNEHEIPAIVEAAAEAGATFAGYTILRLPYGLKNLFVDWLETHFPEKKERVVARIKELRGGRLNDPNFSSRMDGQGIWAGQIAQLFEVSCLRAKFPGRERLSCASFRRPSDQLTFWE